MTTPTRRFRIAICSVGELFGGVERHILGAINGLQALDMSPLLLLFHDGELAAQARLHGCAPIILPCSNRQFLHGGRRLAEVLREHKAEIIHVHGYKAAFFAGIARYWYRCPIVHTEHGLPELGNGRSSADSKTRLYHGLKVLASHLSRSSICYVTSNLQQHLAWSYRGLKQYVIPNAVAALERSAFTRPSEFEKHRVNMVIVGRLEPVKGMAFAIRALGEPSVGSDCHLHLFGDGPLADELRALTNSLQLNNRVSFHGFRRNIYPYLAYADALLMPSLHEGLPYTLLEAMAFGTPIIASAVGGLAETLTHEQTALLIPPENATALAAAISRVQDDPLFARQFGHQGQQLQRVRYSLQSMTARYLEVYSEVLSKG